MLLRAAGSKSGNNNRWLVHPQSQQANNFSQIFSFRGFSSVCSCPGRRPFRMKHWGHILWYQISASRSNMGGQHTRFLCLARNDEHPRQAGSTESNGEESLGRKFDIWYRSLQCGAGKYLPIRNVYFALRGRREGGKFRLCRLVCQGLVPLFRVDFPSMKFAHILTSSPETGTGWRAAAKKWWHSSYSKADSEKSEEILGGKKARVDIFLARNGIILYYSKQTYLTNMSGRHTWSNERTPN